jgi:hypothetical protein
MPRGVSPLDEAQLQGRLWEPKSVPIKAWWVADQRITTSSGAVTQWIDIIGNAVASQGTDANRPRLTSINNKQALLFRGSDGLVLSPNLSNHRGVAIVYRDTSTTSYSTFLGSVYNGTTAAYHGATTNAAIFDALYTASETRNGVNRRNGVSIGNGLSTARPSQNCVQIHIPTALFTDRNISTIGYDPFSLARAITGAIGEIIVFSGALNNSQIELVEGYLGWSWGLQDLLPAAHPFRNRPPLIGD